MIYLDYSIRRQIISIPKNGRYIGKVEENPTYEEGYDKGYQDGLEDCECNEGGDCPECKLGELNEELPINRTSILVHATTRGLDGFDWVSINAERALQEKYNQGYEQGKSEGGEGGSCNLGDLNVEWEPNWNANHFYAVNEGLDGYKTVSISAERALQEKYDEGYNQGKSECGEGGDCPELTELNVTENGTYEGSFNKVNVTVNATDFSSEQVENTYPYIAFEAINIRDNDGSPILDKEKFRPYWGVSFNSNELVSVTNEKRTVALSAKQKEPTNLYEAPSVGVIERGAIDWNKVDVFKSYTITEFGENMTRDTGSNLRVLYISMLDEQMSTDLFYFTEGCFATCNRLNKIVIAKPDMRITTLSNCFEGVSSWGKVIVVGEETDDRRQNFRLHLMSDLPSDWELIFDPDYNEL